MLACRNELRQVSQKMYTIFSSFTSCYPQDTLRKTPRFRLIIWGGNFVQRQSFCRVSGDSLETMQKCAFAQNVKIRKVGEVLVFKAVVTIESTCSIHIGN